MFGKVAVAAPFEGAAKVTIYGLPAKVTSQVVEVTKDTKEVAFPIIADKTSPAGQHNVFAQVVIERGGELIVGNTGATQLRIDVPLPPKVATTPAPNPTAPVAPKSPDPKAPEKRLTRLEQLRKEAEERERAAAGGTQPPPKKEEPKKN
jgi:hypothetical protein